MRFLLAKVKVVFHPSVACLLATVVVSDSCLSPLRVVRTMRNTFLVFFVLLLASCRFSTAAWRPNVVVSKVRTAPGGSTPRLWPKTLLKSSTQTEDVTTAPDIDEKKIIEVTSEVKLPFSREVAYDAYSNLTRQPSWSSCLHSVEYPDETKETSKWTMRFMGIKYSWTAVALRNERPSVIQWQSTSGLRNFGIVKFLPQEQDSEYPTLMTMRMTFVAPRAAAAVFRRSKKMVNFVKENMIKDSMLNFRDVVLENDLKDHN